MYECVCIHICKQTLCLALDETQLICMNIHINTTQHNNKQQSIQTSEQTQSHHFLEMKCCFVWCCCCCYRCCRCYCCYFVFIFVETANTFATIEPLNVRYVSPDREWEREAKSDKMRWETRKTCPIKHVLWGQFVFTVVIASVLYIFLLHIHKHTHTFSLCLS